MRPARLSSWNSARTSRARVAVEVAGRLVGEDAAPARSPARARSPRAAAARRRARSARGRARSPRPSALERRRARARRSPRRRPGRAAAAPRCRARVVARQQVEGLEHEPDRCGCAAGEPVVVEPLDVRAIEPIGARGRPVEAAEDVHQRGLAGPRRPDDRDELALVDLEAHVVERRDGDAAHVVDPADVRQRDDRARSRRGPVAAVALPENRPAAPPGEAAEAAGGRRGRRSGSRRCR